MVENLAPATYLLYGKNNDANNDIWQIKWQNNDTCQIKWLNNDTNIDIWQIKWQE